MTWKKYEFTDAKWAELKKKIAAFKIEKSNEVIIGWPEKTWTIEALEGDEYKCTNGKNVHYFSKVEIEEKQKIIFNFLYEKQNSNLVQKKMRRDSQTDCKAPRQLRLSEMW